MSTVEVATQENENDFEKLVQRLKNNSNIHIKDYNLVFEKVCKISSAGVDKLQAIIDFDRTISAYCDDQGKIVPTSYRTFMAYCEKSDLLEKTEYSLYKKYMPIEFDNLLSKEEKIPHMVKWWKEANESILNVKESKKSVKLSVEKSGIFLRHGFTTIFEWFHRVKVPICVASAGLGDVVRCTIEKYCGLLNNIKYASNFFEYNENEVIVGFSKPTIHSYNKYIIDQCGIKFDKNRTNIIVIGDSIGDCSMSDNLPTENVVKIGFLNKKDDGNLEDYLNNFDIVIESGYSAEPLLPLLKMILNL